MMGAMPTRLVQDLVYEAPLDRVSAMLADPGFRKEVCAEIGARSHDVSIDGDASAKQVRIEMQLPTEGIPSFAKKFVGDTTDVVQAESWRDAAHGDITVTIPGKPGEMAGTAVLTEKDGVTTETVDLQITVRIPLVAGKIEKLISGLLSKSLTAEHRVGQRYLAR
jgi:hypothetical protein